MPTVISLYDYTGNWSRPYREAGWKVAQVEIQLGIDIYHFRPEMILGPVGILIAQPCTDYAISGARHFAVKDADGRTAESQRLVARTRAIVDYYDQRGDLLFWALENPKSRIHNLNPWLKPRRLCFNPCDYAGYDPVADNSRYNKETWLFGRFNIPEQYRLDPIHKHNPGWRNLGGKSLATKNARSITPLGFAYAFYSANH